MYLCTAAELIISMAKIFFAFCIHFVASLLGIVEEVLKIWFKDLMLRQPYRLARSDSILCVLGVCVNTESQREDHFFHGIFLTCFHFESAVERGI